MANANNTQSHEQESYPLPEDTRLLNHQIAGHVHGKGKTKLGMLKHKNGYILKPVLEDKRGKCELNFYETVFASSCNDAYTLQLRNFLPAYKGTWETKINGKYVKYICLEDITECFSKPCVLDIKVGPQTYDPEATPEKILQETLKYPPGRIIGFRILGMHLYQNATNNYDTYGYDFGKQQTPDSILSALSLFFESVQSQHRQALVYGFLDKLRSIHQWFKNQRKYSFYSSSLLFAYEGDENKWIGSEETGAQNIDNTSTVNRMQLISDNAQAVLNTTNSVMCHNQQISSETKDHPMDDNQSNQLYNLKMIDFCHVFPTASEDSNYVFGLRNLINYLEQLVS